MRSLTSWITINTFGERGECSVTFPTRISRLLSRAITPLLI